MKAVSITLKVSPSERKALYRGAKLYNIQTNEIYKITKVSEEGEQVRVCIKLEVCKEDE